MSRAAYRHPRVPPRPEGETDEQRIVRFTPTNDSLWGRGGWVACERCPLDTYGQPIFHSKKAHTPMKSSPASRFLDRPRTSRHIFRHGWPRWLSPLGRVVNRIERWRWSRG